MSSKDKLQFVIQKHAATSLHYDFRLEIGDTMPSWAIPKGPTLDPSQKRLAMMTTDHDLEYRHFEGNIPEGQYGAGAVMVWDYGNYTPEIEISKGVRQQVKNPAQGNKVIEEGLKKGEIKFFLKGKKINGSFALVKTKNFGPKNSWLLIKHKDEYDKSGYDANDYDYSAKSKKNLKEIAQSSK